MWLEITSLVVRIKVSYGLLDSISVSSVSNAYRICIKRIKINSLIVKKDKYQSIRRRISEFVSRPS